MGRNNLAHYDTAPALPTIAPREDEMEDKGVAPEEGVQQTAQANALAAAAIANQVTEGIVIDADDSQPMQPTRWTQHSHNFTPNWAQHLV